MCIPHGLARPSPCSISLFLPFISLSPQSQQKHHISDRQWGIMIILEGKKRMQRGRKMYAGCNPILGLLRECMATLCVCDCAKVIFPKTCHIQRNMGIWVNSAHFCLWFLTLVLRERSWEQYPSLGVSLDENDWITQGSTYICEWKFNVHLWVKKYIVLCEC